MNKKITFAAFAVLAIMATSIISSVPVQAYTYHGSVSSWDRGGHYEWVNRGLTDYVYNTATGYIYVVAEGWCHQDAYLNSAHVDASADVSDVTVKVYWNNGYKYVGDWVNQARLECKLYVNGNYVGTGVSSFPASTGVESFNFDAEIDEYDDLDVDIKLLVDVGNSLYSGYAQLYGTFTTIQFITY